MDSPRASTPTASSEDGVVISSPENNTRPVSPLPEADATSVSPIDESSSPSASPIETDTTDNPTLKTSINAPAPSPVHSQTPAKNVTWGNGSGGWGDAEDTSAVWGGWGSSANNPQITSLTSQRRAWLDNKDALFQWRATDPPRILHRHVSQYARKDLVSVLRTTGLGDPTPLGKAPTPLWARTQLLCALPEAQRTSMPGPAFTVSQLTDRCAIHDAEVQAIQRKIVDNEERISNLQDQEQLVRGQLATVEKERRGLD
ncbi:hypothetical protein V5O48_010627 [Marasmius crinis-equi]|uniref:Uncharacterized protein n=1 Tax=Marasmius crinis-equi TaxID=585013 RepID=A0ABR3F8F3_9AGAR